MRRSLGRTTFVLAAIGLMSAVSFSGCSTSSGFKMPSSDWLSWGKKKPADSSLASRSTPGLPAPPSSLASPNTVPSYAQGSGGMPGSYATAQNRGLTAGPTSAAPASYGTQLGAPNNYGNSGYGGAPGAAAAAPSSQSYGGAGTSQGFYSPDYRAATGSTGAANPYARQANPAGMAGGTGADAYGTYGQGSYAGPPPTNPAWNQGGALAPAHYGAAPNAYGQSPAPVTSNGNYSSAGSRGADGYATGGGAYAAGTAGNSVYGETRPSAGAAPAAREIPSAAVAAGGYRPGSTARSTQFGTSDNLNVPGGESVQPASFAGGSQGSGSSLYAPSPVGSNGSYPTSEALPTRTATGAGNGYPSTYQR